MNQTTPSAATDTGQHLGRSENVRYEVRHDSKQLCQDLMVYFREYARENPETIALWCLGIGFILGWKLKPW